MPSLGRPDITAYYMPYLFSYYFLFRLRHVLMHANISLERPLRLCTNVNEEGLLVIASLSRDIFY